MKKFIEKIVYTIVPHEKNRNIPHLLKKEFIFILVIFVGVLFYFNQNNFNIIRNLNLSATVYPAVLADLANQDRSVSNAPKLTWSVTLENAAKLKAEDMLTNSYFAHTSPSGITPWYWLKKVNYNFTYAGENLAVDFTESSSVEQAWLNSQKHKDNILNPNFTEIGIATVDGVFEGKNTTFVVEFFGKPSTTKIGEKAITNKKLVIDDTSKIIIPSVAGASTENIPEEHIKIIEENKDFIIVKNDIVAEKVTSLVSNDLENKHLSTWYNRFMVNPTNTIKIIYTIIFGFVFVSILLVLSKEHKNHHTKHVIMGIILLTIIAALLYCLCR